MIKDRQILNSNINKGVIIVGIALFIFILIYYSSSYYKNISIYEPIEVKLESNSGNIAYGYSVKAITPLDRSFKLVFDNSSYSSDFAFVKFIKLYVSDSLIKENIQITLKTGENIKVYDIDSLKEEWNYLGIENGSHVFVQPENISPKRVFQVVFSILYWDTTKDLLRLFVTVHFCVILLFLAWKLLLIDKKKIFIFYKNVMNVKNALIILVTLSSAFLSYLMLYIALSVNSEFSYTRTFFIILAIIIFFTPQIIIWNKKRIKKFANILLSIQSFLFTWILAELILFCYFSMFEINTNRLSLLLMSENPIVFDCKSGYKYNSDNVRFIRLHNGETVFDNTFIVNNVGYVSKKEFIPKKNDEVFRFLVLGDSFTSAEYLAQNWTNRIETNINTANDSIYYEFYNFALSGIGIANWEKQFWNEIVGNYDFDAIIFAVFGDNLQREFLIGDSDNEACYFNYLSDEINCDDYENYLNNKPEIFTVNFDENNEIINSSDVLSNCFNKSGFPILAGLMFSSISSFEDQVKWRSKMKSLYLDEKFCFKSNFAAWNFFASIKEYCNQDSIPVVFVSIPFLDLVLLNKSKGQKNCLQLELMSIADSLDFYYYDSYPDFESLDEQLLESFFFEHDPHWNQKGSDFFEKVFRDFLLKKIIDK